MASGWWLMALIPHLVANRPSPHATSYSPMSLRTQSNIPRTTHHAPRRSSSYSLFNASTGFTREAASAGSQLAPSATASRSPAIVT